MIDIGARSTAPWSPSISVKEELQRIIPAIKSLSSLLPDKCILSIDTQYKVVAEETFKIAKKHNKNIILNDVSCLKTDPSLMDFITEKDIPIILMASKKVPGDILTMPEIVDEFDLTITSLEENGYNRQNIILDPGIGHWIEEKTYEYDLKIIKNLGQLKKFNLPILVAISRKSFIGSVLDIPDPTNRLNGTLSSTSIAIYNGAHIVRTHDVDKQIIEICKMAKSIRDC